MDKMQVQFDKTGQQQHGTQLGPDCLCPPVCFQCPPPFCLPCGPGPGGALPADHAENLPGPRQCGPFIMLNTPVDQKTILLPMDIVKKHGREMSHHEDHQHKPFKAGRYKHNHKPEDDDRHDGFDDSVLTNIERRRRGYHKHYNGEQDEDCCDKPHHHHHGGEDDLECCERKHHHHHHHDEECKKHGSGSNKKHHHQQHHKSDQSSDDEDEEESGKENSGPGRSKKKSNRKGIRNTSRELRAGKLYVGCDCEKRNGMQDDCQRSLCMGSAKCTTNPPTCLPSEFSNGKHLAKRREEAERKLTEKYKNLC